jgi:glucosamine-6-phosphate deaminase
MNNELKTKTLDLRIYESRTVMGAQAAKVVAGKIRELLAIQQEVNVIFAAAPSQDEFLENLCEVNDVEWNRVNAFHMDEYLGISKNAPQAFGNFLRNRLFSKLSFKSVNYLDGNAPHAAKECQRYAALLKQYPVDIVCMGIGENGHIAFNDPPVADFNDSELVKIVELDPACRQQQVNDGCFGLIEQVPSNALTLTIPVLMSAHFIYAIVPGLKKAEAVSNTIHKEIDEKYPSTILRTHPEAILFLDKQSSMYL